jgi:MFS family permease
VVTALVGVALLVAWRAGAVVERAHEPSRSTQPVSRNEVMRAFILLSVTMTCAGLIYQAFTVILPKLFAERIGEDFGLGASAIGGLVGLVYLIAGLTMPLSGRLADRFPTTSIYRLAFVLIAPCLFLAAMLQSWPLVVVTVALVILNTLSGPAENKLLAHYTPGRWQGTGYGAKFVLSLGVSASAIPLIALVYDSTGGFVWLFVAMGLLALVALAAALMLPTGERSEAVVAPPAPRPAAAAE